MKSVSVPPVTSFSPAEASPTVLEGGSYNVTCLVSANPPAQVLSRYHHYAIISSSKWEFNVTCLVSSYSYSHTYLAATMSSCHHQTTCLAPQIPRASRSTANVAILPNSPFPSSLLPAAHRGKIAQIPDFWFDIWSHLVKMILVQLVQDL